MKQVLYLVGCIVFIFLTACNSMKRGFIGDSLISVSQPSVSIRSTSLPYKASGHIFPYLYTAHGYQFPSTYIAVYGTDINAPMAVVTLSFTPEEYWEWDPISFSIVDSPVTSEITFDEVVFYGSTSIISGDKDPFMPFITAFGKEPSSVQWFSQRYVCRSFFNQVKIILEYREPLSALAPNGKLLERNDPKVHAFQERAVAAFTVSFKYNKDGEKVQQISKGSGLDIINSKGLGLYLGNMSIITRMRPKD